MQQAGEPRRRADVEAVAERSGKRRHVPQMLGKPLPIPPVAAPG